MTRDEFAALIDRYHAAQRHRLLARFDIGQRKYGTLNLLTDTRDFEQEAQEEDDDGLAYRIWEAERKRILTAAFGFDEP